MQGPQRAVASSAMRRLLPLLLIATLTSCSPRPERTPPAAQLGPPAELVAVIREERVLLACLETRLGRIAPALDAGHPLPEQTAAERDCVAAGVAAILALPVPPGNPAADAWWVALESYRGCRGELVFAATSADDLKLLSAASDGSGQAAWLRAHAAECRRLLDALAGTAVAPS